MQRRFFARQSVGENSFSMATKTSKSSFIALIHQSIKQGGPLICVGILLLIINLPGQSAQKKFSKFILGINAGLGKWTTPINRDILLYALPTFPPGYSMMVSDTDTDVNAHYGFNLQYNFTPTFGLMTEFSRINAEYLIMLAFIPQWGNDNPVQYDSVQMPWIVTTVYINGVYNFKKEQEKIVPFAFAGVGFNILHTNRVSGKYIAVESKSSVDLGLKAGGGMCFYLPRSPLGFELRAFILYLAMGNTASYGYQSYTSPTPIFSGDNLVWGIDLGLKYRF